MILATYRLRPSSRSVRWPAVTRPSLKRSPSRTRTSIGWWRKLLRSWSLWQASAPTSRRDAVDRGLKDNPKRLRSEASFARLCGVSPIEASSGKVVRHRFNRGGNREANRALYMICLARMRRDRRTQEYVARRTAEGKSKREIIRCLKRYVAREAYRMLIS
jgi:transposase